METRYLDIFSPDVTNESVIRLHYNQNFKIVPNTIVKEYTIEIEEDKICELLELIDKKNINDIKIYNCVFNKELVYGKYGTIFYGTLFHYSQTPFFTIEDIFYCEGNEVVNNNWSSKFNILIFLSDIQQKHSKCKRLR
jgi:hypothetical protein